MNFANRFAKINFLFVLILVFGFILRIYKLPEIFTLDGDIARDWLVIFEAWKAKKPILVGPLASFAGIFNGPWYYYTMAPVVIASKLNPLAIISFSLFLGLLEIFLIYKVAQKVFGQKVALVVGFFYTLSYSAIKISHALWNPNFLPVLTLIILYFLIEAVQGKKVSKLVSGLITAGFGLQFHYGFALIIPAILWVTRKLAFIRHYRRGLVLAVLAIFAMFLPLLVFELRHGFVMSQTFILYQSTGRGGSITDFFNNLILAQPFRHLFAMLFTTNLRPILAWLVLVFLLFGYLRLKKISENEKIIWQFFFITLFLFMLAPLTVHQYYLNPLLPVAFLLFGSLLARLQKPYFFLVVTALVILFFTVLVKSDTWQTSSRNRSAQQSVSQIIASDFPINNQFNIVNFGHRPFHSAWEYRFLVRNLGFKSLGADQYNRASVLYLISEGPMETPLKAQSYETSQFGPDKVEKTWKLENGWQVFKLIK